MASPREATRRLAGLSGVTALLACVACNGIGVLAVILSLFGITLVINPHMQAAAISLFALITVVFVYLSYNSHRNIKPLILAGIGAIFIVGTMYIAFNKIVESIGLLMLIAAAVWSWRTSKQGLA